MGDLDLLKDYPGLSVFDPEEARRHFESHGEEIEQVIVAIMRKLLHQIFGILKSGQPYNPEKRGCAHA